MDTERLLKIAIRVQDRAASDPEFEPALEQLERLLRALEQGESSNPQHAFAILSAAIMLDIMCDPAHKGWYVKERVDAMLDNIGKMPPSKDFLSYYRDNLENAMRKETEHFFGHVLKENLRPREFLAADYSLGDLGRDEGPAEADPTEPIGEGESTDPYLDEKIKKIQGDLGRLAKGLEQIKYEEVSKGTVKAIDQDFVEFLNNVSCQIKIKSKNKDRCLSGCLVSHDGSVLTCAHNLTTDPIQIKFASGVNKGTYKADKVHVDKKKDIALLKINKLSSTYWLKIDFNGPEVGEEIIAVGHPSFLRKGGKDTAVNAITKGNIISVSTERSGKGGFVADITVASGSSGSPIISQKSRKVIGVVTEMSGPENKKKYRSTGFVCHGTPTNCFPELSDHIC